MNNQLCWFRTDLRVRDNPSLSKALQSGPTRAIYIATPDQWQQHDDAPIKLDFWRRNLVELQQELKALNVNLHCFQVADYKAIPALMNSILGAFDISQLHYNREYPLNEKRRDDLVDKLCAKLGVSVSCNDDQLLVSPSSALNKSGEAFKVFTPFSKRALEIIQISNIESKSKVPTGNKADLPRIDPLAGQRSIKEINWPESQQQWEQDWPAGEKVAMARLDAFAQSKISSYTDNRDIPSLDSTSELSAYLAAGVISVADCWRTAHKYCDSTGVETWKNELLWRDFYRHITIHFPRVCMHKAYKENTASVPWRHDAEEFEKWCKGQTGYPLVDAGMRQLLSTGWMHNRLRMVTAMFLSKHLLIDWRWGERWFMQNLVDGDFASNNGGWQWSASTGVDAVPYFRIFNPTRQSQRFDSEGRYIRQFVPELAEVPNKSIHKLANDLATDYPAPIVDHAFARERALNAFKNNV
jgi:deoxyribodipyrimidine photo-lyase